MKHIERLEELASSQPDKAAVVRDEVSITYRELNRIVSNMIGELLTNGVGTSDVVGIELEDEIQHFCAFLAAISTGAGVVTLASHDSAEQRARLFEQSAITRTINRSSLVAGIDVGTSATPKIWIRPQERDEGRVYLRTSGTTGFSNIVPFSETQIAAQSLRHPEYATERLLRLASIEHNNSKRHRLYCFWQGGTNVFKSLGAIDVVAYVKGLDVTCLDVSRMHVQQLLSVGSGKFPSHVKLRTGGSAVPYGIRKKVIEELTPELYVRYAATECGAISMAGPGEHDEMEAVGVPLPGVDLRIVDEAGKVLGCGVVGRIAVKMDGMASEYLHQSGSLEHRFQDGYFLPGDLGYLLDNGRLIVVGRSDDMIIFNGLNIFPIEIERVLERFPGVSCAAVAGMASETHGSIPVAIIEVDKHVNVDLQELYEFSRESLGLKTPRKILIVPAIPRNSQNKIIRSKVTYYITGNSSSQMSFD